MKKPNYYYYSNVVVFFREPFKDSSFVLNLSKCKNIFYTFLLHYPDISHVMTNYSVNKITFSIEPCIIFDI